jgi:hypothetical protein
MTTQLLKQMSIGETLDGSIAIFRRHFPTLVGIAIVCQGGPTVMYAYIELAGGVLEHPGLFVGWTILSALGGLIAAGATLRAISQAYLGTDPRLEDSLSYALGKIGPLFIAGLAKYLIIALAMVAVVIPVMIIAAFLLTAGPAGYFVITLGVLASFIPAIVIASGYALVPQVVVLEDLPSSFAALNRSWMLTEGYKGRVFLVGLVVYFIVYVPTVVTAFFAAFVPGLAEVVSLLGSVFYVVLFPIVSSAFTLLYYDLRLRKEAFDLELLSQQMGVMAEAS